MRFNVEISEENVAELESIMLATGIHTIRELVNNAITLFEWAAKERSCGNIIASLDEDTGDFREVVLPALQDVVDRE